MKKNRVQLHCLGIFSGLLLWSSCAMHSTGDQWKDDNARYKEQLKRYPDRESAEQQKAQAEAARKADGLRK